MSDTFPFIEVLSDENDLPVTIFIWHIRSVRPLRDPAIDKRDVTRIEYTNGDTFDCSQSTTYILTMIREQLRLFENGVTSRLRQR